MTRPLVDPRTVMPLRAGYYAAWCVGVDGEPWPWVVAQLCACCEHQVEHGDRDQVPAHEHTGRLPREVRELLGLVHRCGAFTRSWGTPCRQVVPAPGEHCGMHRDGARG